MEVRIDLYVGYTYTAWDLFTEVQKTKTSVVGVSMYYT